MNKLTIRTVKGIAALSLSLCTLTSCFSQAGNPGGDAFTIPEEMKTTPATSAPSDDTQPTDTPSTDGKRPLHDYSSMDLAALVTLPEDYRTRDYSEGLTLMGTPTDEYIDAEIRSSCLIQLAKYPDKGEAADVELRDLDRVVMDYTGTLDGVAFQGGSATDSTHDISILHSQFIDGFDRGMLGMKTGETRELNLKFPDNYGNASLAGKSVVFTVTVDKIIRPEIPELTDDLVATNPKIFGEEFKTAATFRKAVVEAFTAQYKASDTQAINTAAWAYLIENTVYHSLPENILSEYESYYVSYYTALAKQYGMTLEKYATQSGYLSLDAFKQEVITKRSISMLKEKLVIHSAAQQLGLSVTDEQAKEKATEEFKTYIEPDLAQYTFYYGVTDLESFIEKMCGGIEEYKDTMLYNEILKAICDIEQ